MKAMDIERISQEVRAALESLEGLPLEVEGWCIQVGEDWMDHEAVWVWVELADKDISSDLRQEMRDKVRSRTHEVAGEFLRDPWVYVRVLARSEEPTP